MVKYLIENGADVRIKYSDKIVYKKSILELAEGEGNKEIIQIIKQYYCKPKKPRKNYPLRMNQIRKK